MDKKQMSQRCLAFFLAIIMIVGVMPLNVFAGQDGDTTSNNEGKVPIQYVDEMGNAIKEKYHIVGQEYPSEAKGKVGDDVDANLIPQPKFIGYVRKGNIVVADRKYVENGGRPVEVPYEKLLDIIPAKDDYGNDNPKATEDVKATYKSVTIKVDGAKGLFRKGDTAKTETSFVYYVNPVGGKTLQDVLIASDLTAESKDENANKIDANKEWKFTPNKTKTDTPADVALGTAVTEENFKNENVVMEVNFKQTMADQLKDKLEAVDIRVWVGDQITWKDGVKLKEANTELQNLLDEIATTFTDLGKNDTDLKEKRNSSRQNLPNGATGSIEVKFGDKSRITVPNQTLYVANEKNVVKAGESNQINPENLPDGKFAVEFKLGEGVKIGDKEGNTTPVLYETYYVKPGTSLDSNEIPATTLQNGYKDNKWYNGTNDLEQADYTNIESNKEFVAKATKKDQKTVEYSFKFYNSNKPTAEIPKSVLTGKFEPTVPSSETKYEDDDITLPTITPAEHSVNFGDMTGIWKFDGWYKDGNKVTNIPKVSAYDNENKFVGKWVLTETERRAVTRKFDIDQDVIGQGKPVPQMHRLPEGVKK